MKNKATNNIEIGSLSFSSFSVIIVFSLLTITGLAFIPLLPMGLLPKAQTRTINVSFSYDAGSGLATEQEVTSIIEGVLSTMRGLKKSESESYKNGGSVTLEFDKTTQPDKLRLEASGLIRQIFPNLPKGVSYPQITVQQADEDTEEALLSYTINSSLALPELNKLVENRVKKYLSKIKGIYKISLYGAPPYQTIIEYNYQQAKKLGISEKLVANKINEYFKVSSPGVSLETQTDGTLGKFAVEMGSSISNISDLENIPLKLVGTRIILLKDIVTISRKEKKQTSYYKINGLNTVNLIIYSEKKANSIQLGKQIKAEIARIKTIIPSHTQLILTNDSTVFLEEELTKIAWRTGLSLGLLIIFIYLSYRSFNYLFVIILTTLSNIGLAFIIYYVFDIQLHLYSMAGITISFGLIIDSAIVIAGSLVASNGKDTNSFPAVVASAFTTAASLSIIFFLDDEIKIMLTDFAAVMIINLLVSLLCAKMLIPALLNQFQIKTKITKNRIKQKRRTLKILNSYSKVLNLLARRKAIPLLLIILLFGFPVFLIPAKVEVKSNETSWYNKTIGSEYFSKEIRPIINIVFGGSLRLFTHYVFENSYYSKSEKTALNVYASLPPEASHEHTAKAIEYIENYLAGFKEIKQYSSSIYQNKARINILFKEEYEKSSFPYLLKSRLTMKALDLDGISWNIFGVGKGYSNGRMRENPSFRTAVYGYNFEELNRQTDILQKRLLSHPRIQKVTKRTNKNTYYSQDKYDEYVMQLNRKDIAQKGYSPADIMDFLHSRNYNKRAFSTLPISGNLEELVLLPTNSDKFDKWELENSILGQDSAYIRLKSLVNIKKQKVDETIFKENRQYRQIVEFQYTGTAKFGAKYLEKVLKKLKTELPPGYRIKKLAGGWVFFSDKTKKQYSLILLAAALIFGISAILLESFKLAFSVIAVIPVSYIGVFLTFYFFNINFDQGGYASFVLLSGITVNSALYIINDYNYMKKKFVGSAINKLGLWQKAYSKKIYPILLTAFSTIIGFVPFLISGQDEVFWFALAAGTSGGLIFSLIGIIFILPLFFFKGKRKKLILRK